MQSQKEILNKENQKYIYNKNNNNNDNGHNYYSHQEHEPLEQAANSNAWNCFKAWAMQASSDENTSRIDPPSKVEQNVKNTKPRIPKPKPPKIA